MVELLLALELPFRVAAAGAGSSPGRSQGVALALHSGCPVLVVAPRKVHLCWTGTFLRVPTLCRDRGGTRWDRPRSQEQLDICGEMRDAVETSPLSGKSESWYGSVRESNRKTCSGETPQRDQCPTLGIRNLLWNSFCSPLSSWLERHLTWLVPWAEECFLFQLKPICLSWDPLG